MRVILATSNPGKVREANAILAPSGLEIVTVPMWIGDVETGEGFLENARLKATNAMRLTGAAVLAEDSGIEVDALGGLPGHRSARFAGSDADDAANNARLLALLDGVADRGARYRAVAVLLLPTGRELIGEGTFEGAIGTRPRGDGGFGYDPLFIPSGEERTAAELSAEEKNAISHRSQALRAIASQLD